MDLPFVGLAAAAAPLAPADAVDLPFVGLADAVDLPFVGLAAAAAPWAPADAVDLPFVGLAAAVAPLAPADAVDLPFEGLVAAVAPPARAFFRPWELRTPLSLTDLTLDSLLASAIGCPSLCSSLKKASFYRRSCVHGHRRTKTRPTAELSFSLFELAFAREGR